MTWTLVVLTLATGKETRPLRYPTLEDCALAVRSFQESNPGKRFWCEEVGR